MDNANAKDILAQMFIDGFPPPDLRIATPTRTFDVHKSVVCEACPFFKAACDHDWKEAQTGVINLPEDEVTVSEMLEHCYGTRSRFGEHRHRHDKLCSEIGGSDCVLINLKLLIAAEKYQLKALCDTIKSRVHASIGCTNCTSVVEIGLWVYQDDRRQALPSVVVWQIVHIIARGMQTLLMAQPKHWSILQMCPELLKDVICVIAQRSDVVQEHMEWTESEYLQVSETDKDI